MIFQFLLLILLVAITFFHYTQGLFSAAISAICAIIAAVIAVSYHEPLAGTMLSHFPQAADSVSISIIFAVVYLALRICFDSMVPGNVRFPLLMEKIGAAVMGVIVGVIATGIVALAAQMLPYSPDIAGYARFKLEDGDRMGHFMKNQQMQDVPMHDVLKDDSLDPDHAEEQHLWLHQDDAVLALTEKLSDDGSLAGDRSLASVHPDYPAELFGQRLGIQVGTNHVLLSPPTAPTLKVTGVFTQAVLPQVDGEIDQIRGSGEPLPKNLAPQSDQKMLIIRTIFGGPKNVADDADSLFRFSPGSVRLLAPEGDGDALHYKDYNPVATLDPRGIAVNHRVDDFLISDLKDHTIDFIFIVDADALKTAGKESTLYPGAFLEVKRYGTVDLSSSKVVLGPLMRPDAVNSILYKDAVKKLLDKTPYFALPQPGSAQTPPNNNPKK